MVQLPQMKQWLREWLPLVGMAVLLANGVVHPPVGMSSASPAHYQTVEINLETLLDKELEEQGVFTVVAQQEGVEVTLPLRYALFDGQAHLIQCDREGISAEILEAAMQEWAPMGCVITPSTTNRLGDTLLVRITGHPQFLCFPLPARELQFSLVLV